MHSLYTNICCFSRVYGQAYADDGLKYGSATRMYDDDVDAMFQVNDIKLLMRACAHIRWMGHAFFLWSYIHIHYSIHHMHSIHAYYKARFVVPFSDCYFFFINILSIFIFYCSISRRRVCMQYAYSAHIKYI